MARQTLTHRSSRRFSLASPFVLAALLLSSSAHADPSAADQRNANTLVLEGRRLLNAGDAPAALTKFQAAYALMRAPTTGLEVATAFEAMGKLVEARAMVDKVIHLAKQPNEPPTYQQARATAASAIDALSSRIPALVLRIEGAPKEAITATVDGDKISAESLTAPLPLNPGKREVIVTAPGYRTARATVELVEGVSKPVEVPLVLERAAAAVKDGETSTRSNELIYAGIAVSGALAVVGLGTAIGAGALYGPAQEKLDGKCELDCKEEFESLTSTQQKLAYTSLFTFIGAGLVGGATVAYWMTGKKSTHVEKSLQSSFVVMPGGGGVFLSGRW
jgi:tetratricopeptide (TPR) repeat protein